MIDTLFLAGVSIGVGIGTIVFTAAWHSDGTIGTDRSLALTEEPDREFEY